MGWWETIGKGFKFLKDLWSFRQPSTIKQKIGSEIYKGDSDVFKGFMNEFKKDQTEKANKLPEPPAAPGAWPADEEDDVFYDAPSTPTVKRKR